MKTYSELAGNRKKRGIKSPRDNRPQIKSKGTLQAQEMRQLGEAGVAAWKMLADYLNISVQQAMDKVQKRQVDSQTATTAILLGMNKQFAGQLEAQAGTFNGRLTVMTSTFKQAMTQAIFPVFTQMRDNLFPSVTAKLREFTDLAQYGTLSLAFKSFLPDGLVDSVNSSLNLITENINALKLAVEMLAAAIGTKLVAGALAPMIAKLVLATQTIIGLTRAGVGLSFAFETAAAGALGLGRGLSSLIGFMASAAGLTVGLGFGIGVLTGHFIMWKNVLGPVNSELERFNRIMEASPGLAGPTGIGQNKSNSLGVHDRTSAQQAAMNEGERQRFLNQDRLFIEQVQANQRTLDNLAATPVGGGTGSGSGESKYNKFVQGIKEQMKVLKRSYEIGRISIEEYTEALDKLARTPGLKEVHQLDIIKQKWQALEPIWKQYQDSIDKAEDARLDSYEKGKKFIIQWNATEIEMEKAKAASVLEIQAERDEAELDAGAITKETLLQRKIALEEQMFAVELKALQDRLALGGLEVSERASINQQILQLQIAHNLKLVQLEIQLQQQRKTMAGVAMQEYAATQQSAQDKLVSLPTQLADVFAKAAAGYGSLSDMLKSLAQELVYVAVKAMLLKAVMGLFGGGMFGGANLGGLMGVLHGGGIVGSEGSRRFVSMLPKFHSGGISGDEQLSVLRKGEGVFTPGQMKAMGGDTTVINMTIRAIDAKGVNDFFVNNRGVIEGIAVNSIKRSGPVRRAMKGA